MTSASNRPYQSWATPALCAAARNTQTVLSNLRCSGVVSSRVQKNILHNESQLDLIQEELAFRGELQ